MRAEFEKEGNAYQYQDPSQIHDIFNRAAIRK